MGYYCCFLLSACKVSKDVAVPKNAALPDAFRNVTLTADTLQVLQIYNGRIFFTDATLQNLIDSAIERNYDMLIAVKNIEASQLLFKQVKWNYVPQVDANVTASSTIPAENSLDGLSLSQYNLGTNHIEDYSANLSLSWEADIWGKIRNQSKGCFSYLPANTVEAKKLIQTNLVASVSQGYYNLLMLDAQLDIAQKNVRIE